MLVLAGLGLLVGAVLFFGGNRIRHGREYETYFRDSVQGLDVGAPVKYRGVAIGAVTQIGLSSAEYGRGMPDDVRRTTFRTVFVRFDIDTTRVGSPPNEATVREGLRARIAPQGLTGQSYLELDFPNNDRFPPLEVSWTPRYTYIPSIPSTLSQVQDAATGLLAKLQQVDINGLATNGLGLVEDLRATLRDGDGHTLLIQATATLKALQTAWRRRTCRRLSAELRQTLVSARALAQGPQTRDLLRSATAATDRLAQAAAKLPATDRLARRRVAPGGHRLGGPGGRPGATVAGRAHRRLCAAANQRGDAAGPGAGRVRRGATAEPGPLKRRALLAAAAGLDGMQHPPGAAIPGKTRVAAGCAAARHPPAEPSGQGAAGPHAAGGAGAGSAWTASAAARPQHPH